MSSSSTYPERYGHHTGSTANKNAVGGDPTHGERLGEILSTDNLPWARRHGIDLMLAGHVHGGQVRFPLIGSVLVPSRYSRRYDMGTFFEPPTLLHVNRGLSGKEPLRFRCNPQVTRIVLRDPQLVRFQI